MGSVKWQSMKCMNPLNSGLSLLILVNSNEFRLNTIKIFYKAFRAQLGNSELSKNICD